MVAGQFLWPDFADYFKFQEVTGQYVFYDYFMVTQDEAVFCSTGLYKWMVWNDDTLSLNLAIT